MPDQYSTHDFPAAMMRQAPKLGSAAKQIHQITQAPYELGLASVLAAASSVCQALIDIEMPYGGRCPASLAILVVAPSGERKTAVLSKVMRELIVFDQNLSAAYESSLIQHKAEYAAWRSKLKGIEKSIKLKQGNGEGCQGEVWCLEEHLKKEPKAPRPFQLLYKDVSPLAMLSSMAEIGIGSLITSEGGEVLDGKVFESIPHLNSAWSGDEVSIIRVGKPAIRITDPRLTICMMVQPGVLDLQSGKKGMMLRDSGHWARYIVMCPESTQGSRFFGSASVSSNCVDAFGFRLKEMLDDLYGSLKKGDVRRDVIRFSSEAADRWIMHADMIEHHVAQGGRYEKASDHASKIAENIARVAAIIHLFEGFSGNISPDIIDLASMICLRSSEDYMALFVPPPQEYLDANILADQFFKYRSSGMNSIPKTYARQRCHNSMRKDGRFYRALDVLVQRRAVWISIDDKRMEWINLDMNYNAAHQIFRPIEAIAPPRHAPPYFP